MAMPELASQLIDQLCGLLSNYIETQRRLYLPRAVALTAQQRSQFAGFFSEGLLAEVRLCHLHGEQVANPDFYPMLRQMGFTNLPDQSTMSGITFRDVVVLAEAPTARLLFHEFVHVEQYRQLGLAGFSDRYVRGFLSGGGYMGIPLEQQAYSLDERFAKDPSRQFSVKEDVAKRVAANLF
jgi:hypothetical protein